MHQNIEIALIETQSRAFRTSEPHYINSYLQEKCQNCEMKLVNVMSNVIFHAVNTICLQSANIMLAYCLNQMYALIIGFIHNLSV